MWSIPVSYPALVHKAHSSQASQGVTPPSLIASDTQWDLIFKVYNPYNISLQNATRYFGTSKASQDSGEISFYPFIYISLFLPPPERISKSSTKYPTNKFKNMSLYLSSIQVRLWQNSLHRIHKNKLNPAKYVKLNPGARLSRFFILNVWLPPTWYNNITLNT